MESLESNVYLLSMTTYLLIWKTNKYCDISFVNLKKQMAMFWMQRSIICKDFIKYNKMNGITPMKIHVECAHPKLFGYRKL